jgi:hypothetical protein
MAMGVIFAVSMEWLWVIVPIACYLIVPVLIIYATFCFFLPPEIQPINHPSVLPAMTRQYFFKMHEGLTEIGFAFYGTYLLRGLVKNVDAYLVIYYHPEEDCGLMLTSAYTTMGGVNKLVESYIEMTTTFVQDPSKAQSTPYAPSPSGTGTIRKVSTGNQKTLNAFRTPPHIVSTVHPKMRDPAELFAAHQSICRYMFPGKRPIDDRPAEFESNPLVVVYESLEREMSFAVKAGFLKFRADTRRSAPSTKLDPSPYAPPSVIVTNVKYVPTFIGAFRMTWKQLFPMKQVFAYLRNRRSKKLLRDSGFV